MYRPIGAPRRVIPDVIARLTPLCGTWMERLAAGLSRYSRWQLSLFSGLPCWGQGEGCWATVKCRSLLGFSSSSSTAMAKSGAVIRETPFASMTSVVVPRR